MTLVPGETWDQLTGLLYKSRSCTVPLVAVVGATRLAISLRTNSSLPLFEVMTMVVRTLRIPALNLYSTAVYIHLMYLDYVCIRAWNNLTGSPAPPLGICPPLKTAPGAALSPLRRHVQSYQCLSHTSLSPNIGRSGTPLHAAADAAWLAAV